MRDQTPLSETASKLSDASFIYAAIIFLWWHTGAPWWVLVVIWLGTWAFTVFLIFVICEAVKRF